MDHKLNHTSSICLIYLSLFIALNITSPFLYASESKIEGKKIASIEIKTEGGERIEWLKDMISLKEGDLYSSRAVRKSLDQLYKDGRFKDITIDAELTDNGVVLAYSLIEKEIISEIEISGNWFVSAKELMEEIRASEGEEITDDLLREILSGVISYYHKKGFFHVEVEEVLKRGKGMKARTQLRLNIREGKRTKIRELRFSGERVVPDINLLFNIKMGKGEFFSGETLERDIVSMENFYKDKGYFNAIIGPPDVKYNEESNEVDLLIPIEAGRHTKIVFEGNSALSSDKLESLLLIEEERSSDDDVLKASIERIEGFYKSKG
ncbi:MAG: POTRA domain-containing protein, partial [Nitrospirota bacterium]